jgi:hypothetical protein
LAVDESIEDGSGAGKVAVAVEDGGGDGKG